MKHKHIDAARELRLWLRDIIIPAFGITMMVPEARETVVAKYHDVKNNIANKFKKH